MPQSPSSCGPSAISPNAQNAPRQPRPLQRRLREICNSQSGFSPCGRVSFAKTDVFPQTLESCRRNLGFSDFNLQHRSATKNAAEGGCAPLSLFFTIFHCFQNPLRSSAFSAACGFVFLRVPLCPAPALSGCECGQTGFQLHSNFVAVNSICVRFLLLMSSRLVNNTGLPGGSWTRKFCFNCRITGSPPRRGSSC